MKPKLSSIIVLLVFGIGWSAMTLFVDSIVFRAAFHQLTAVNYSTTQGTILSSSVIREDGSDDFVYKLAISYEYTVSGRKFVSHRYRYGNFSSSDCTWAHSQASNLAVGKSVPVFYRASNPSEAVLVTGLQGSDLFMAAFLLPFNMVSLAFIWFGGAAFIRRWRKPVAGGAKIFTRHGGTIVRHPPMTALAAALCVMTLVDFLSLFPVCFFWGGFNPSLLTMEWVYGIVLVSGLVAFISQTVLIRSGKYDLLLDPQNKNVSLPKSEQHAPPRRVPFASIKGLTLEAVENGKSEGDPVMVYVPTLHLEGTEPPSAPLPRWTNQEEARAFVDWLASALRQHGTPLKNPEAPTTPPPTRPSQA